MEFNLISAIRYKFQLDTTSVPEKSVLQDRWRKNDPIRVPFSFKVRNPQKETV